MHDSGIVVSGNGLQSPRTATRVRVEGGKRQVQDGPFADTHEHLGGYFIVETPSLDDVLEWAARAPCASAGSVEVRPVTTAFLLRTTAGITSALVIFKLLDPQAGRLHEDLSQYRDDLVPLGGCHPFQPVFVE